MTVQTTLQAPVTPLLTQIALLLREGVDGWIRPDPYAAPYWAGWNGHGSARTGCPAGHFLFSPDTRIYTDDVREEIKSGSPYCVVALADDPQPRDQRVPSCFWDIPVTVEMAWPADAAVVLNGDIRSRLMLLTGLLTTDVPGRPVAARLSGPGLLVYGNDSIHSLKAEPLRLESGHPAARLTFTVLCSSLPPL